MVKFSKQLEGQLVPEWRGAYVTYKLLKKDLNFIKQNVDERRASDAGQSGKARHSSFFRVQESFESFVGLTGHTLAGHKNSRRSRRDSMLVVNILDGSPGEVYESVLVDTSNDAAAPFFTRLDSEFNKVNLFYRNKEKDFIDHADTLERQMHALIEMQRTFSEQQENHSLSAGMSPEASPGDLEGGRVALEAFTFGEKNADPSTALSFEPTDIGSSLGRNTDGSLNGGETSEIKTSSGIKGKAFAHQMRMRIPVTSPGTTISVLSHSLWSDILKYGYKNSSTSGSGHGSSGHGDQKEKADEFTVTRKKIQLAEKMIRAAFIEYYRGLALLRSYSSLNMVAFAKILKKFDKVSGLRAASTYLKAVESSYFNTSDKIIKLMEKVEVLFTEHFAKSNRHKAMLSLRTKQKRASHYVTFALGLFSGGSLALLVVFIVLTNNLLPQYQPLDTKRPGSVHRVGGVAYFETIFPVFSLVALILLHIYMYGVDLYFWRRLRINYPFIFEFHPGTELRHREVLMVASILTTLLMGAMVVQLALHSISGAPHVDLIPFFLLLVLVALLFLPLNLCYRSSRAFFLHSVLHILGSPLYKVVLADFFLADQLTSQVPMLRNLQYVLCYYCGGFFRTGSSEKCLENSGYKAMTYLISLLPYWWRLMQCARRFFDEADHAHIANGGKYLSALIAVVIRIQYGRDSTQAWRAISLLTSLVATAYQLYWDLFVDWGLLRKDSVHPWLRDRLMMHRKQYMYFLAMVINVVLRMAWLQSVTRFKYGNLNEQVADFAFASLEVIRRGHWNFYRLENEHLNNVGKYRATRTVPLPFEDPSAEEDD